MIHVTKAYLPNVDKYKSYVDRIFQSGFITNRGELLQELEEKLKLFFGVKHLILVANGTLALQISYRALGLKGEVITSPFSFVATANSIKWENLDLVFADIDKNTFNINPDIINSKITSKTSAIVPVHVYGNPCDIDTIQKIADDYNLKVIYDAAHAFGVNYRGKSILQYGDISTLSFHATKLFHTIEGGAIITNNDDIARKVRLLINFGISGPLTIESIGINAKMNEFEAAMGLCVLDDIEDIMQNRSQIWERYVDKLSSHVTFQEWNVNSNNNYAYAPVVFESEDELLRVEQKLNKMSVFPRRYFYPSLDTLTYLQNGESNDIARDVASRVMCLPQYAGLFTEQQDEIIQAIVNTL